MPWIVRPVGTASSTSRLSTCDFVVLCTSTIGDEPDTVTDSSTPPTFRSVLMVAMKFDDSSIPSFLTVVNPGRSKVSV